MYDEGIMIYWIIEEILIIILRSQNTISNITVNQVIKEAVFSFDIFCSRFARMFSSASPGSIQSLCLTVDCVEYKKIVQLASPAVFYSGKLASRDCDQVA